MASSLEQEITSFIHEYATLFASSAASSSAHVGELCQRMGKCYRPGLTMFTSGRVERFETHEQASTLIEREMRNNISTGLGTKLVLRSIDRIEPYSSTSAVCWLTWTFEPQVGSEFEGKGWTFTNVYGYRGESEGRGQGWEFVVRDREVEECVRITGRSFE